MAYDPIASRYAQAAFDAATASGQVDATLEQLTAIGELMRREAGLRQLLRNPDVDPDDKAAIISRLIAGSESELTRACIRMIVEMGRAEYLPDIAEAFGALVDEQQGRLRVVVRSARPLPEAAVIRLRTILERRERKQVEMLTEIAPELIGGVQVQLGHRVIDGSVRRQLTTLRERLSAVRLN